MATVIATPPLRRPRAAVPIAGWRVALIAAGIAASFASLGQAAETAFVRGDANIDGKIDISDAARMLLCTFGGVGCSSCADAADANDDGERNVADPVYVLSLLFAAGPRPRAPGETCGFDLTADTLDCESYPLCAGEDSIPTSRGPLVVTPINHASLVLQWDGTTIYSDPVGASRYTGLPAPDIVLLAHEHSDHLDANTLKAVVNAATVLVAPKAVMDALSSSGVLATVDERMLANGDSVAVGDIAINAVPAYNSRHPKGRGNGYVLDLAGTRVYISGDTEDIPEMRALRDIDLAFLCMNTPTMTAQQAASAALEFLPRVVYPFHYSGSTSYPAQFKSLVEAATDAIIVRLRTWE